MADKTIRESFFDAKAIGSLWDVAVSLKRGNPLPIDADSVFESEAKLIEYIGDKITTVAYPGQIVAVVNADSTQVYYIDQELNYKPVGTALTADGTSIEIDNNVIKLAGFDDAADGLLAQVKVDDEGNRSLNWISITEIAKGDGNTTYAFTGAGKDTDVYFEVQASDAQTATKIYLDTYSSTEIDKKLNDLDSKIAESLTNYYNKDTIDETVTTLEGKISAIPKFAIEVVTATEDGTPDVETPSYTTVYLIPDNDTKTADVYDEYIYIKVSDTESKWELLGKQTLDLTGYATTQFVTDEINKLSEEGGAISEVAKDVADISAILGDSNGGLIKDVDGLKAFDHDKHVSDAISTHTNTIAHLTSTDVDNQITSALTTADYDSKINEAQQAAIAAALIKSVNSDEFTVNTDGQLSLAEVIKTTLAGKVDSKTTSYNDKDVEWILLSPENQEKLSKLVLNDDGSVTTGQTVAAGDVDGLDTWLRDNGKTHIKDLTTANLNTDLAALINNSLQGFTINDVEVIPEDGVVNIPIATTADLGVVKSSDAENNITVNNDGTMSVNTLNVNKLVQTEGEELILNGGSAKKYISNNVES